MKGCATYAEYVERSAYETDYLRGKQHLPAAQGSAANPGRPRILPGRDEGIRVEVGDGPELPRHRVLTAHCHVLRYLGRQDFGL